MIDDLKPCPWCGRVPVRADISGGGPAYWVECYRCEATGPVDTSSEPDNAVNAWNTRPVEDALQARAEAAEQRAEAAEAEVARLRADALLLAGLWHGCDRIGAAWNHLDDAERARIGDAYWAAYEAPTSDIIAGLKRVLARAG